MSDMLNCCACGKSLPVSEFYKARTRKRGYDSWCKKCRSQYRRERYAADPEYRAARCATVARCSAGDGRWTQAMRNSRCYARQHGYAACTATPEELKAAFTGRCAICGVPEAECRKRLAVDHDHQTGDFRGFLCQRCNQGLGLFKDNSEVLEKAAAYLQRSVSAVAR